MEMEKDEALQKLMEKTTQCLDAENEATLLLITLMNLANAVEMDLNAREERTYEESVRTSLATAQEIMRSLAAHKNKNKN